MQQIQLYINGQRVDMFKDESIQLTSSIQNVRDIGAVFTDYTQTFTIPASKTNNKIFKHYEDSDIDNGYDGRFRVDAKIELNHRPFRSGKIKLNSVNIERNAPKSYNVTFYGSIVNLKDLVGDDKLDSLTWLRNFNETYNETQVKDILQNGKDVVVDGVTYPDAITVPLVTHSQRLYYDTNEDIAGTGNLADNGTANHGVDWTQLKPAIKLYIIVKAIEKKYNIDSGYVSNIVFSEDFFNIANDKFYDLSMWLHRKKGSVFDELAEQSGIIRDTIDTLPNDTSWNGAYFYGSTFSIYDVQSYSAQHYNTDVDINTSSGNTFNFVATKDGAEIFRQNGNSGSATYNFDLGQLVNGSYDLRIESENTLTLDGSINMERIHIYDPTETNTFAIGSYSLLSDFMFEITEQIPDMKVIDFLTSIFKMFNLTAYEEDGVVVVKPLDTFYLSGTSYDITDYVDSENAKVSPSLLFNKIKFGYAGNKTVLAENHNELFNLVWGEEEYDGNNKFDGNEYKVDVGFEHMKFEKLYDVNGGTASLIQWGWMADQVNDDGSGGKYIGKPLVFYPIKVAAGNSIRVTNDSSYSVVTKYTVPSNSIELVDSFNINFKAEVNEYANTIFKDTLFRRYYSNYISSVFDFKNRITEVTAYLPIDVLSKFKMEDKFVYKNKRYIINSIDTDLSTGKSDIELINEYKFLEAPAENVLPEVTTNSSSGLTQTEATLNGTIDNVGVPNYTQKGFYWIQGTSAPTSQDNVEIVGGTSAGSFSTAISSLSVGTTYSFRAFATNLAGTALGDVITFTTQAALSDPAVQTTSVSDITQTTANLIGNITALGNPAYTSKGFYWVQGTGTPTASDNVALGGGGIFTGSYGSGISGLVAGQTYSYRAFVSGSQGTFLGAVLSFQAAEEVDPPVNTPPSVSTYATSYITSTSAVIAGSIDNVGDPNYYEKGFVWLQGSGTPTTSNNKIIISGTGGGYFDYLFPVPTPDTTYSVQAYAISSLGTYYGGVDTFLAEDTPVETCDGGTLYFTDNIITGINATLQTAQITYGTGECGTTIPTVSLLLTNNESGEWVSASQVTSISLYENGSDVSSQYTLSNTLNAGQMFINIDGNFPDIFNDGDHFYQVRVTAYDLATLTTTISLPPSNSVDYASVSVTPNTSTSFPASRNDSSYNTGTLYPTGEDGDAYEYTITLTADAGFEFTGLGNVTLLGTTGAGVTMYQNTYNSSTYTIIVTGTIQASDVTGSVNWTGSAVAQPATSFTKEYRIAGQSTWLAYPVGGINVENNFVVEVKIDADGAYSVQNGNPTLIASVTPNENLNGDILVHTVTINGGLPETETIIGSVFVYPRGSGSSIGSIRFNYLGTQ